MPGGPVFGTPVGMSVGFCKLRRLRRLRRIHNVNKPNMNTMASETKAEKELFIFLYVDPNKKNCGKLSSHQVAFLEPT